MKILALVFPGFTFIDLAAPMQALMMLPEAKSQIVWQKKGVVASDAGVDVHASEDFQSCWKDPDILFVPGNTLILESAARAFQREVPRNCIQPQIQRAEC
jgi:cyclohexyl-isocyanide hydratase